MQKFQLRAIQQGEVVLISIEGYFGEDAGKRLVWEATRFFQRGLNKFVVDFSACEYINSVGLTNLLDMTLKVVDDRRGRVLLAGVNQLMVDVIAISGIDEFAEYAPTVSEAMDRLSAPQ